MNAIRIRKQLTSNTLELPELTPLIGRVVEILVIVDEKLEEAPRSAVRFALDDGFDLERIGEAVAQSGALSRLA
jgi:hypothetical protein